MKVSLLPYKNAAKPHLKWQVSVSTDGKRSRKFFRTKKVAEAYKDRREIEAINLGKRAAAITDELKLEAHDLAKRLEQYGKTLTEAVEFFIRHMEATKRSASVDNAAEEFLAAAAKLKHSKRYKQDLKSRLKPFRLKHGALAVSEIDAKTAEDWLATIDGSRNRINYRRVLSAFFAHCKRRGYCEVNPIADIPKPKDTAGKIDPFRHHELRILLDKAGDPDIRAYIAIGGLAGLRESEIRRLDWSDVRLDDGLIDLSATQVKTATRRLVTILPRLDAILRDIATEGPLIQPNFDKRLKAYKAVVRKEGVAWKPNGLRKGFISHHLAMWTNVGRTAHEAGHSDPRVLYRHYREIVSKAEASEWFCDSSDNGLMDPAQTQ